jgi:hypothetical protein
VANTRQDKIKLAAEEEVQLDVLDSPHIDNTHHHQHL